MKSASERASERAQEGGREGWCESGQRCCRLSAVCGRAGAGQREREGVMRLASVKFLKGIKAKKSDGQIQSLCFSSFILFHSRRCCCYSVSSGRWCECKKGQERWGYGYGYGYL